MHVPELSIMEIRTIAVVKGKARNFQEYLLHPERKSGKWRRKEGEKVALIAGVLSSVSKRQLRIMKRRRTAEEVEGDLEYQTERCVR